MANKRKLIEFKTKKDDESEEKYYTLLRRIRNLKKEKERVILELSKLNIQKDS